MSNEFPHRDRRQKRRRDFESTVGTLLLAGVMASVGFILAGYVWRFLNTGTMKFDYSIPGNNLFQFWVEDARQALSGQWRPRLLINWGIAILMATPYLRVLVSVIHFAFVEHNWKYTVCTLLVFTLLSTSLFFNIGL